MTFERHLFISYAHIDNEPLTAEQEGWVTRFHHALQAMVSTRIGRKAEIWRDEKISGNDIFADEIIQQFPKTALLVSVLSPSYVHSTWCTRELDEFCHVAQQSGGVAVGNKSRIIKVIKMPIDSEDELPPPVKQTEGYEFYARIDETPLELDPAYGADMARQYNLRLARLALDVKYLLEKLEAADLSAKGSPAVQPSKPAVYLAQCCSARHEDREALVSELRLLGYPVLPDRALPIEEPAYIAEVARLLKNCVLSIHLVGSGYGLVPDGSGDKSVVVLQNELAVQRSRTAGLRRVIWLPEGTRSENPAQQRFIEALHTSADAQFGADLITGDLEALKRAIHTALESVEKPRKTPPAPAGEGISRLVYVICDERDRQETVPLRKTLKSRGLAVEIPLFEGGAAAVRQTNEDLLKACDAVVLYYGSGDEAWKRSVQSDLKKIAGYGRARPFAAVCTYLAQPATSDKKELIELEEPNVINGLEGFSESSLQPFIETLRG